MTHNARRVLADCVYALELLEQASTNQIFRIHWFATVTLVRTVGDVLKNVDGKETRYELPVQDAYLRWKDDRQSSKIFWQSIRIQRNKLVHEYESDLYPSDQISLLCELSPASISDKPMDLRDGLFDLCENLYRPMIDGPWAGEDSRDVLKESIEWWKSELDKIDLAVTTGQP
jgi:hypothetical protein